MREKGKESGSPVGEVQSVGVRVVEEVLIALLWLNEVSGTDGSETGVSQ